VKDENGDLLADSYNIFNRWENYFSQLLNMHMIGIKFLTKARVRTEDQPPPSIDVKMLGIISPFLLYTLLQLYLCKSSYD
jgi:hypothetical protein